MKIAICGSMSAAKEMVEIKKTLINMGHIVELPHNTELFSNNLLPPETNKESAENKIKSDLFKYYFWIIKKSDAILVINIKKNNIDNYIWGNSLIEMAFAHILSKKIFLLNSIPELSYTDEIIGLKPIILNWDFNIINKN